MGNSIQKHRPGRFTPVVLARSGHDGLLLEGALTVFPGAREAFP